MSNKKSWARGNCLDSGKVGSKLQMVNVGKMHFEEDGKVNKMERLKQDGDFKVSTRNEDDIDTKLDTKFEFQT